MDTIKNLIIDGLNGMSINSIPFFLFQLLVAGFLGWIFQLILRKKSGTTNFNNGALISTGICLIVAMVKYMLPFSVLGAAAILLLLKKDKKPSLFTFLLAVLAVGCGIGSVIPSFIGGLVIAAILLFVPLETESE
ncbi:MAG: hypothetical protein MK078_10975 [Crocinitomicaceae bacterium]|nr:hypothetical protein [Crocinitomicaceae bacterium]